MIENGRKAAMIYHHEPPCNEEYTDSFPFNRTRIRTGGKRAKAYEAVYGGAGRLMAASLR